MGPRRRARAGHGRHDRARRVHSGTRWRPHRGHGRGDRRRTSTDPAIEQGAPALMSVSTNELKNGMTLDLDGTLFQVVEFQHVKPGKGGAFVRTKLRNLKTGGVQEKTFNAGVKVGLAIVERKDMQYLYRDADHLTFMDLESYEQIPVPVALLGEAVGF